MSLEVAAQRVVSNDDAQIGFGTLGTGSPLVAPGSLSSGREFLELAELLSPDFFVVLVDPRGRPLSSSMADDFTMDR